MPEVSVLSASTRRFCIVLCILSIALAVGGLIVPFTLDGIEKILVERKANLAPDVSAAITDTPFKSTVLTALAGIASLVSVLIPLAAARVFAAFSSGKIFRLPTVRTLRLLGLACFTVAFVQLIMPTLLALAMTYDNPPGKRTLLLAVSTNQLFSFLGGAMALIIAQILTEAVRIAEENGRFV